LSFFAEISAIWQQCSVWFHIVHTHHPLLPMRGGLQTSFLQTKARTTAAGCPNGSNEDDTTACLVFLVYLFAGRNKSIERRTCRKIKTSVGGGTAGMDVFHVKTEIYLRSAMFTYLHPYVEYADMLCMLYSYICLTSGPYQNNGSSENGQAIGSNRGGGDKVGNWTSWKV
jgi:hypothetical protein